MTVLRWIGYCLLSLLVLSVVLGIGAFIGTFILVIGAAACLIGIVAFGAFCIKSFFEDSNTQKK